MKKLLALTVSAALMVGSMSSVALAAESPQIVKTDTAPVIDGELDAVWEKASVQDMPNYIVAVHDNAELDPKKEPEDFSGEWRALWDDEYFYIFADIKDDVRISINHDRGERFEYDDSLVYYISDGQSKENYTQTLFHIASGEANSWTGPYNWLTIEPEVIKQKVNDYGDGYSVEIAVPWEWIGYNAMTPDEEGAFDPANAADYGLTPEVGMSLFLDVQATDNDLGEKRSEIGTEGRYPQSKITWSDEAGRAWENPAMLGEIVLADASAAAADAPAGEETDGETPSMPQTGMGGADSENMTAWLLAVLAVMSVVFVGVRKIKTNR